MLPLLAGSLFASAVVVVVAGVVELHTAVRLLRIKRGHVGDEGTFALTARVHASHGVLQSPVGRRACVMFSLLLVRLRLQGREVAGTVLFHEQRPFTLVDDRGGRLIVDGGRQRFFVLGLDVDERPLPFLPQTVVGLLVRRFGRMGHRWAEHHLVRARESALLVDAAVHALVQDGVVRVVSPTPLFAVGRGALLRGLAAIAVALVLGVGFLALR